MNIPSMDPRLIANSRRQYLLYCLLSLVLVAGGAFSLISAERTREVWIGWTSIILFGACAVVCGFQFVDLRPRLRIDDRGIDDRTLGVGLIPWSEIKDAYVKSILGNDFVCLRVRDPNKWLGRLSPWRKALIRANLALGFTELNINLSGTNARAQQIHELILNRSRDSQQSQR